MKAVVVLNANSLALQMQAGEVNRILIDLVDEITSAELWLFYQGQKPDLIPKISPTPSNIKLIALDEKHTPESYLHILEILSEQDSIDLMLFASDGLGAELATRLSYRLDGSSCLQVASGKINSGKLAVIKPVYGNNLQAEFTLDQAPYYLSVNKHPSKSVEMIPVKDLKLEMLALNQLDCDWIETLAVIPDPAESGLNDSNFVLVVGQGAGNKETVEELSKMANSVGAELGASRPVVMNAWADMNRMVGVSGQMISPKLCIAAGVSGSSVFKVGIENSDFIIAINTDPKAPIFQIADVGVIADLKAMLIALEKVILNDKKEINHHIGSEV